MWSRTWVLLVVGLALLGLLVAGDGDKETDHSNHDNTHGDKTHADSDKAEKKFAKGHHTWTYNVEPEKYGASQWNTIFADKCGSAMKHQSPINIVKANVKHADDLGALDILLPEVEPPEVKPEGATSAPEGDPELATSHKGVDETAQNTGMLLFSNGHTAQVNVEREILVVGGGLGSQYKVAQFHFHWGKNGEVGSEHRIDGNMFMLEMHIVTFDKERFSTLTEAVGQENGIAVLGILFKGGKHNPKLNNVVDNLKNLPQELNKKIPINWFDVRDVLPSKPENYYRYTGSLTTPMCYETVKWTVFAEHPTICPEQMKQFYNLTEGHYEDGSPVKLVNNWRPPQPLNGRTVQASFTAEEKLVEYNVVNDDGGNASSRALTNMLVLAICMCLALLRA